MAEIVSAPTRDVLRPLVIVAAGLGIAVAAALVLWAHYGSAVFYEMIVTGLAACL